MSDFSPTEAALEGLRITRERPVAVLWWWLAYGVATVLQFAISLLPPFKALQAVPVQIQAQSDALQRNPNDIVVAQQAAATLAHAAPAFLSSMLLVLVLQMVLSTAVLRAVLRPADSAFGYLRLSLDEARQLGLASIMAAIFIVYAFAVSFASFIVLGLVAGLTGGPSPAAAGPIVGIILLAAFVYPAVRLSLAPSMTFADGRISIRRAWTLTKGRFWSLFGAYALATVFGMVVVLAITVIQVVLIGLLNRGTIPRPQGFVELLTPVSLSLLLVNSLLGALVGAIQVAPLASAFRQLTGRVGAPPLPKTAAGSPWSQA